MTLFYTTNPIAFYDDAIYPPPAGATEITAEVKDTLMRGQALGQIITVDDTGLNLILEPPPVTASPLITRVGPLEFFNRFTPAEETALGTAAMQNVQIFLWFTKASAAAYIDLTDPLTIAGVGALVTAGLLTQARATTILTPLPPP